MAAEVCCATWNGHPRHSRQSIFPHLKRGSFLHGVKLSQLRNNKQAPAGHSRLCCCNQTGQLSSTGPDISLLRPELQRQWHQAKNHQLLGNRHITASSGLHVWWTCDQCPCGCAHEWLATVSNRQDRHSQCPFCTNHRLCQHNLLLTVAPAVAAYWDSDKNGLTPDQVMASSSTRRHWLCSACGHSWQAMIYGKVDNQSGCPKCSSQRRLVNRQPSLTQSGHPAMTEFDFERNQRAGLDPDTITAGSGRMVHWICNKCPQGQPHLFMARPFNRIGLNSGCPYCNNKKACVCNSLQSLYPALAAEYDTAKNGGVGPEQVLPTSQKMAFWKDARGQTWEHTPSQRTASDKDKDRKAAFIARQKQQALSGLS